MDRLQADLMDKPSIGGSLCPFCGRLATNRHHIVFRSQGGGDGPTVNVCGFGNTSGCHGLLHQRRIHLRWGGDHWEWIRTREPMKYSEALKLDGWERVHEYE